MYSEINMYRMRKIPCKCVFNLFNSSLISTKRLMILEIKNGWMNQLTYFWIFSSYFNVIVNTFFKCVSTLYFNVFSKGKEKKSSLSALKSKLGGSPKQVKKIYLKSQAYSNYFEKENYNDFDYDWILKTSRFLSKLFYYIWLYDFVQLQKDVD